MTVDELADIHTIKPGDERFVHDGNLLVRVLTPKTAAAKANKKRSAKNKAHRKRSAA